MTPPASSIVTASSLTSLREGLLAGRASPIGGHPWSSSESDQPSTNNDYEAQPIYSLAALRSRSHLSSGKPRRPTATLGRLSVFVTTTTIIIITLVIVIIKTSSYFDLSVSSAFICDTSKPVPSGFTRLVRVFKSTNGCKRTKTEVSVSRPGGGRKPPLMSGDESW